MRRIAPSPSQSSSASASCSLSWCGSASLSTTGVPSGSVARVVKPAAPWANGSPSSRDHRSAATSRLTPSTTAPAPSDASDRTTDGSMSGISSGSSSAPGEPLHARSRRIASEAACKPSSVPRLAPSATVIHLDRRSPDGSCSRPEGWAAHLSPRRTGVAPSYLALLRVEFAAFHSVPEGPASSLWHWSSPRGGRALPATLRCGARTFLTSAGCPASARPSGRLAGLRSVGDACTVTGRIGANDTSANSAARDQLASEPRGHRGRSNPIGRFRLANAIADDHLAWNRVRELARSLADDHESTIWPRGEATGAPAWARRRPSAPGRREPPSLAYAPRRARATRIGPPAATRSSASLASRSAVEFCARGTCVAVQRVEPARASTSTPPTAAAASRP